MSSHNRVSFAGLLIALGIIYGDIGTSPLYVLNAITSGKTITEELIVGSLSLIIWTLTLQTTIKYVLLTLKADNRGNSGYVGWRCIACRWNDYTAHFSNIGY
jgi:KUP system potassium uptake protein